MEISDDKDLAVQNVLDFAFNRLQMAAVKIYDLLSEISNATKGKGKADVSQEYQNPAAVRYKNHEITRPKQEAVVNAKTWMTYVPPLSRWICQTVDRISSRIRPTRCDFQSGCGLSKEDIQ